MARPMVIAIDGPAGAGKSTVTRLLAQRLKLLFLDTGAMYRAATVGIYDAGINVDDPQAVADWVCRRNIGFDHAGQITAQIWRVADNAACRAHLVQLQKTLVAGRDVVVEGRDATTVICPDAQLKIFLDASPEERARRRLAEWPANTPQPNLPEMVAQIRERDQRDSSRAVGALTLTDDAVHLYSDGLAMNEVIARITAYAVQRQPFLLENLVSDQLIVGRSRQPGYVRVAVGDPAHTTAGWQLGLTNPTPERMPGTTRSVTRNLGGRQAGTVLQGQAILCLAGTAEEPSHVVALPMLPQTWYIIEPGAWHAVIQSHGTICAWAESSGIREEQRDLTNDQFSEMGAYVGIYLPH